MALDFAESHREDLSGVLKQSRAGRWFVENKRMEAFDFVADVGASEVVPEVVSGKLRRAGEPENSLPLRDSDGARQVEES
jgi:phosphosulfolactate phosphohydrolase-like enzyme